MDASSNSHTCLVKASHEKLLRVKTAICHISYRKWKYISVT